MMLRTAHRSLFAVRVTAALAVFVAPIVVQAQSRAPRIAVAPFGGERAAVTRSMIAGVFANHTGEVELASLSQYNGAAARLGVSDRSDEASVSQVAREMRADCVVTGMLERRGTAFRLALRVLRGSDGAALGRASWEFERIEELNAFGNEIWEQLRGHFRVDPSLAEAAPETPRGAVEPSANNNGAVEPAVTSDAPQAPVEAATPGLGWLHIHLGGGVAGRRWRIPLLGETTQRGYENSAYGELRATLAAYYRMNENRLGLGVEASLAIPLGLSSQGRDTGGRTVPIPTSAIDLSLGASLALRPTSGGMYRFFAGLTYHSFSLDTTRLSPEMRLATATYVGLRIAGEGIFPLYARRDWEFGIIFGGELRVAAIGSELKEAFGVNPETTVGLGTWFGLNVRLDRAAPGLALRATADFLRYTTDYAGSARIGTPGDSVDDYSRFMFSVVYALGTSRGAQRRARDPAGDPSLAAPAGESAEPAPRGATTGDPFGNR